MMKTNTLKQIIVLCWLSLVPMLCAAQSLKVINSFLGIKLGSTKAQVIAAMKAKGATIDRVNSTTDGIVFKNVTLAGKKPRFLAVQLVNQRAAIAIFSFAAPTERSTIDFYNNLVSDLNKLYGDGQSERTFNAPYVDGDGNELEAIAEGNADYHTNWGFDDSQPGSITLQITQKLGILLSYYDKALMKVSEEQEEKKRTSDL